MPRVKIVSMAKWAQRVGKILSGVLLGTNSFMIVCVVPICVPSAGVAARIETNIAELCDRAAVEASRAKGVPLDVLRAISRTETGQHLN